MNDRLNDITFGGYCEKHMCFHPCQACSDEYVPKVTIDKEDVEYIRGYLQGIFEEMPDEKIAKILDKLDMLAPLEVQDPYWFPSRRSVEREIEDAENPKGLHLNDSKERVTLPGGTLRRMLAIIDRLAARNVK